MRDSLDLGPTPAEESCEQLGPNYRPSVAQRECREYIAQLKRHFGEPPFGAHFRVHRNDHDFGTYLSVEIVYDDSSKAAVDYAYKVESEAPTNWDAEAKRYFEHPEQQETLRQLEKLGGVFTVGAVLKDKQ